MKYFLTMLVFLMSASNAGAVEFVEATGKVTRMITSTDNYTTAYDVTDRGTFIFEVENLPNGCTGNPGRVIITSDHKLYSTVVAMIVSAKSMDKNVYVLALKPCSNNPSAFDFGSLAISE